MEILNCCPKKPKMSLDYIIKWIEAVQIQDLKPIFDDYAEHYDWAHSPEIESIEQELGNKISKPVSSTEGNVAIWNASRNLVDLNIGITDSHPIANDGNLITSGAVYEGIDTIDTLHKGVYSTLSVSRNAVSGSGDVSIGLSDGNSIHKNAYIDIYNIDNLNRALNDPDTVPTNDSNNLVTSSGIYDAIKRGPYTFPVNIIKITSATFDSTYKDPQTITINNNAQTEEYNDFVSYISDKCGGVWSAYLNGVNINCICTIKISDEQYDEILSKYFYRVKIVIGELAYTGNVIDDSAEVSTFSKVV